MSRIRDDFHQADKAVVEPWECDATETVAQAEGLFELVLGGAGEVGDFAFGLRALCRRSSWSRRIWACTISGACDRSICFESFGCP